MERKQLCSVLVAGLIALSGSAALGPKLGAQASDPPRPNVSITRMPALEESVWPADFNQDGITDLVAGRPNDQVVVLFGIGDGTFSAEQVIATGFSNPVPGDFNEDGHIDVAVTSAIIPGNGNGTFGAPVPAGIQTSPQSTQVADMNGDGHPDLVASIEPRVHIYAGNGDFSFAAPVTTATIVEPLSIAVGDFNGDTRKDFAVTESGLGRVQVFLNQGGLAFAASTIPFGRPTLGITSWDWNNDGILDLIVSTAERRVSIVSAFVSGFVHILLGNGDGTFQAASTFPTNPGPRTAVVGDFNRDGVLDVATGNLSQGASFSCETINALWTSVSILPGLGNGGLGEPASFALGNSADSPDGPFRIYQSTHRVLNTSDLNADGRTDLIASPGAVLLSTPPAENRLPVADAGPNRTFPAFDLHKLAGAAVDPDNDWLTFRWTDQTGKAISAGDDEPCISAVNYPGVQTFTLTVSDGRGGVATDTVTHTFGTSLPSGWSGSTIGDAQGTAFFDGSTFTVRGSGADIWGTVDAFQYADTFIDGDFEFTARVVSVENVHQWTKAGLMIREGLSASDRHAFLFATPAGTHGVAFQRRTTTGGTTVHTSGPFIDAPVWLRLRREGDLITAFAGASGTGPWTTIGTETLSGLASGVRVGLAVTSHVAGTLALATFDGVSLQPFGATLPAGWASADVGAVSLPGSASSTDGTAFTVQASGADIWGTSDQFHYVYRTLTGDGTIIARVATLENSHQWTKAGVMMRASLAPASAHASMFVTPGGTNGLAYQRRINDGDISVHTSGGAGAPPVWVALWRTGNIIQAFRSDDGVNWVWIGGDTFQMPETIYIGLAVTSHDTGVVTTATFDGVSVP